MERVAARVVLLDEQGRVLLLRGGDPARAQDGHWWFTPGGGLEPGEGIEDAARREVREETGLELPAVLGPVLLQRRSRFSFEGRQYDQTDHFFRVVVAQAPPVDYSGWTADERRVVQTHRWWSAADLRTTTETIYPPDLLDLLPGGSG